MEPSPPSAAGYNPYAPPEDPTATAGPGGHLDDEAIDATKGQRFGGYVIDRIGALALTFVGSFCIGVAQVLAGVTVIDLNDTLSSYAAGVCFVFLYYVPQEALFGRTLGKLITGTKVVSTKHEEGGRPGTMQVLGRTLARFIPFEPFSAFMDDKMWHDNLSNTRVIKIR